MGKKTTVIANFNCTFGPEDKPMMEYFDTIIYPAFQENSSRDLKEESHFFENVEIKMTSDNRYILTGILVKRAKLEVKTEYDYNNGLTSTNKIIDSAPISFFTIFLDNHRMIYTLNQKGSANIRQFGATVKSIVRGYVRKLNIGLKKEDRLPMPTIDVVSIPSSISMVKQLEEVSKINKVTFKLFSPNGDIDTSNVFENLLNQLSVVGSKRGDLSYNSPTNMDSVIETVEETKGLVEAKFDVNYKNGGTGKIEHDKLTEKFQLEIEDGLPINSIQEIITNTYIENSHIKTVSEDNKRIYEENKSKIIYLNNYRG